MPEEALSASLGDAQSPLKFTDCFGGCGTKVPYRTNSRVYCPSCKVDKKRESARKAADVQRRKNGIAKVKGETFKCQECNSDFVATSKSRAKFCSSCRDHVALKRARKNSYAKDPNGTRKRVGRTEECKYCGQGFVADQRGHVSYCTECRVLQKANKLPHLRENIRVWRRKRYKEDPKFALNELMRGGISRSLRGMKDWSSWTDFVDYTVDELKAHLERQFTRDMTWENRGEFGWHIDHILPIASFDYDGPDHPEFKACWALTNLRPLWGNENSAKKDKILYLI